VKCLADKMHQLGSEADGCAAGEGWQPEQISSCADGALRPAHRQKPHAGRTLRRLVAPLLRRPLLRGLGHGSEAAEGLQRGLLPHPCPQATRARNWSWRRPRPPGPCAPATRLCPGCVPPRLPRPFRCLRPAFPLRREPQRNPRRFSVPLQLADLLLLPHARCRDAHSSLACCLAPPPHASQIVVNGVALGGDFERLERYVCAAAPAAARPPACYDLPEGLKHMG
jgi:hypothetical protein